MVADGVATCDAAERDDSSCRSRILRKTVEAARVEDAGAAVADSGVAVENLSAAADDPAAEVSTV